MSDLISREDAINAIYHHFSNMTMGVCANVLHEVPSAQPEIIRCKDCKYQDENWRRVSVRWLPCMDVRTGSNWYCGSAERGEQ